MSQERIARFRAEQQKAERQAQEAVQRRNAAEARSNALDKTWNEDEKRIAEINNLLKQRLGNLGELFGVTRQVAGDAANTLQQSILSTQYGIRRRRARNGRSSCADWPAPRHCRRSTELERLWYELMREMTDAGRVVKYRASVLEHDNTKVDMDVVRVGPFTVSSNGDYLGYLPSMKSLAELNGKLEGDFPQIGRALQAAVGGTGYVKAVVDPARGALLGMYVERPGIIRRIQQGEAVAYVIVAVGILGVVLALFQAVYLVVTRFAVVSQLKNLRQPEQEQSARSRAALVPRRRHAYGELGARGAANFRGCVARSTEARAVPVVSAARGCGRSAARTHRHGHRHDHHVPRDRGVRHERSEAHGHRHRPGHDQHGAWDSASRFRCCSSTPVWRRCPGS